MKRIIQLTVLLILISTLFWACVSDENEEYRRSGGSFSLQVERYDVDNDLQTRATGSQMTQLVTAVYNAAGVLQRNVHTDISADNSFVRVEGLADGVYKVAFMGVGEVLSDESPTITAPENISDTWLNNTDEEKPCLNEYFYAEADILVSGGVMSSSSTVTMRRIVSLVEIAPIIDNPQFPLGSITEMTITFDKGTLYSGHFIEGGYTGSTQFSNYIMDSSRQFYTLPSRNEASVKGYITIYGKRYNDVEFSMEYTFDVSIGRNKKTIIRPHYDVVGDEYGTIRLFDAERNASNSQLFFQDGQSYKSVAARSFYPERPLTISFSKDKKKAIITHCAAVGVKDVTILAKRINDVEYFELAWLESMKPFEERTIELPANRFYKTESGGVVHIDDIETKRLYFKYRSNEAFLNKINKSSWPVKIEFVQPDADTLNTTYSALAIRPVHAREYVVLFTNIAYVLSNGWKEAMLTSEKEKPLVDDKGNVVPLATVFFPKIWNPIAAQSVLKVHIINHLVKPITLGIAGIGYGSFYGLQQKVLFNCENSGYLSIPYHEYGHVLGYGHESSFTYNQMTSVSSAIHGKLYQESQTPYTTNILHSAQNPNIYKIVDGVMK